MTTIPAKWAPDRLGVNFVDAWSASALRANRAKLLLFGVMLLLCLIRAFAGLVGSRLFSHDAFMLFDGAWRMLSGQRPHIDFYSHVGFLTYLPTLVGLWLSRGTAWGFGYGQAIVALLLGAWSYLLGRKRLADVPLIVFCVTATLFAVAPFAPGFQVLKPGPSTTYNRFGYVLAMLCVLESFVPARLARNNPRGNSASEFTGGFSTGAIIAGLFFLKITYFVFAIFLVLTLIPCRRQTSRRWTGIAAGGGLMLLAGLAYLGFHVKAIFADLVTIGGGKQIHFDAYMLDEILQHAAIALTFTVLAATLLLGSRRRERFLPVLLLGVLVSLTGVALILGNSEESGFPLAAFLVIFVLNELVEALPPEATANLFRTAVMLLGTVLIGASLFSGALGLGAALAGRVFMFHRVTPLNGPRLSGFIPAGDDYWYTEYVNTGLGLVRQFAQPGDSVMSLDFSNPFSYALAMRPAPGGTTVLQYRTTFNDRFRPSPEKLFGAAKLVALPKFYSDGSLELSIPRLYGPYLKQHFHLLGQTKYWQLYRQN